MFLGGGPALSCVSRACFVGARFVGAWSCAPAFLAPQLLGLHVFCECFVSVIAIASANASAIVFANASSNAKRNERVNANPSFLNSDRCILIALTH